MNETIKELFEQLNTCLENRNYRQFADLIDKTNPIDIAEYIGSLPDDRLTTVFRLLKKILQQIFLRSLRHPPVKK